MITPVRVVLQENKGGSVMNQYYEDLGGYIIDADLYAQLIASGLDDGFEDYGYEAEYGGYLVNIYSDEILKLLKLGDYSGGGIIVNQTGQGGPM